MVGGQINGHLDESEKSAKQKSAEQLAGRGVPIRIMSEADFGELLAGDVAMARATVAS